MISISFFKKAFLKVMFRHLPDSEEAAPAVAAMMTTMYLEEVCSRYAEDSYMNPHISLKEWTTRFETEFSSKIEDMLKSLEKTDCK